MKYVNIEEKIKNGKKREDDDDRIDGSGKGRWNSRNWKDIIYRKKNREGGGDE